jgi:hypothetical protein
MRAPAIESIAMVFFMCVFMVITSPVRLGLFLQ